MTNEEAIEKYIPAKKYLGDGLWIRPAGFDKAIILSINGIDSIDSETSKILLDSAKLECLRQYVLCLSSGVTKVLAQREKNAQIL